MAFAIYGEVWEKAPQCLTPAQFIVLLRLADGAGEHRMVWEAAETLATKCRTARRTVFYALAKLKELNIIDDVPESEWPPEAHLYESVVRRIKPADQWLTAPDGDRGAKSAPALVTGNARHVDGAKSAPNPGNTYGVTGGDPSDLRQRPSRTAQARLVAAADAELDPAKWLGLDAAPAEQGAKPARPDSNLGLAQLFHREISTVLAPHQLAGATNLQALARNFSIWRKRGVTPQQIRAAITAYVAVPGNRNPQATAWRDFCSKSTRLLAAATAEETAAQVRSEQRPRIY